MNDALLFFIGCFVSVMVASAVGLLLWGAANEPRGSLLPRKGSDKAAPDVQNSRAPKRTGQRSEHLAG